MIRIVDDDAGLHALAPEWDALWRADAAATPFQSPHWLLPWWRHWGTGMPRVAVQRGAGLLALYVLPGERKALPIGAGTTDYLDALGDPRPLLPALLDRLRRDPIDGLDLIEVPPWSALRGLSAQGWVARWQEGEPCPVLALAEIPGGIRRKLRMNRHRAERAGGWAMREGTLDELVRLHGDRWAADGESGVLADPATLAFWRDAMPGLQAAGLLRLRTVLIGGAVAAAILALLAPGRIFFYLSGYDRAHAFVSPGTLLLGAMLEEAVAEGRTAAHFLRGREAYKYAWGAVDRPNYSGRFVPCSRVDST